MTMEEAKTLDQGTLEIGLRNAFLKNSYSEMKSAWAVDIKGDVFRTDLSLDYGLTDRLEVGMELPRLSCDGGFSVIHQGEQWFREDDTEPGLSDIILRTKYQWAREPDNFSGIATILSFKLPTADGKRDYLGSQELDCGISTAWTIGQEQFTLHFNLGYTVIGGEDIWAEEVNLDDIVSFGGAVNFPLSKTTSGVVQITGNTSPFPTTGISKLDNEVVDLAAGLNCQLAPDLKLQIAGLYGLSESSTGYGAHLLVSRTFGIEGSPKERPPKKKRIRPSTRPPEEWEQESPAQEKKRSSSLSQPPQRETVPATEEWEQEKPLK